MDKWRGHGFGSWDIVCNGLVDGMRHFSLVVVADGRLLVAGFRWQAFGSRLWLLGKYSQVRPLLRDGRGWTEDGIAFGQKHGCRLACGRQLGLVSSKGIPRKEVPVLLH